MELCAEDTLKLNVLLANSHAIRINEQTMCVHGMTDGDDAMVKLNPNCPPEKYLRLVREMLSTNSLGSPRGYPVYLRRWTRLGDMQNTRLESLLMLAEDEAVIAVARTAGLTNELAARIWWALPTAEVARYMLVHPCVVHGAMGRILADYLTEYLPFEEVPGTLIETVRLILQPGLISDAKRRKIWQSGARKNHYYVGFLQTMPDELPDSQPARADYQSVTCALQMLTNDPMVTQLTRVLSTSGQTFLSTCERVLLKPVDQDVVVELLDAMYHYFAQLRTDDREFTNVEELEQYIDGVIQAHALQCAPVRERLPALEPDLRAMLLLAHSGEPLVRPIFARSDAVGSLMRKKIAPVANAVLAAIARLLGKSSSSP
jgi:hypothetical protein